MEENRPFPRMSSPPDSTASSPTPSSVESYGERDIGVHPSEKVFNFPRSSSTESGGPVTLTNLTPISPSNEVSTDYNVSSALNFSGLMLASRLKCMLFQDLHSVEQYRNNPLIPNVSLIYLSGVQDILQIISYSDYSIGRRTSIFYISSPANICNA